MEAWEAQAFIQTIGDDPVANDPYFVVHWRNLKTHEIQIRIHQSWFDVAPFELDSAERVFGLRGTPLRYRDPWVVITRSPDGRVYEVARDMTGQARLQHVLMQLTLEFGPERRGVFKRMREAERRKRGLDKPVTPIDRPEHAATPKQRPPL